MILKRASLIALPALCVAAIAFAHSGATGIVKERMEQMKAVAQSMKIIGAMMKGESPYEATKIEALSLEVMRHGGEGMTKLFPKGSLDKPTEARAEIWENWDKFAAKAADMSEAALVLSKRAGNARGTGQPDDPNLLFRDLANTCKSCHQDFRIKK